MLKIMDGKWVGQLDRITGSFPGEESIYRILYVSAGSGLFTVGANEYPVEGATMIYLHPNEEIRWRYMSGELVGAVCCFRGDRVEKYSHMQSVIDKYGLFPEVGGTIIRLTGGDLPELNHIFSRMYELDGMSAGPLMEYAFQAWVELLMIVSKRTAASFQSTINGGDSGHVRAFFRLLETETSHVNSSTPVRIKTAKEFADRLFLHPNYLNVLMKRHTGLNVSAHIKKRLLEESKELLVHKDWTLQTIAYVLGFSDQPNFSQFFKKRTGVTPAEYRRSNGMKFAGLSF